MQLETSHSILHYFPPNSLENPKDIPKYALQARDQDDYNILPLLSEDKLTKTEDRGNCQFKIDDTIIGTVEIQDDDKRLEIDEFCKEWQLGLDIVDNKSQADDSIIGSLKEKLTSQRDSLMVSKELDIRILSWNLHGDPIYENENEDFGKLLNDNPDLIIVCFQETIPLNAKNLSSSPERVAGWEKKLLSYLPSNYKKVKSNRLLGLTLMILSTEELANQINSVTTSTIGTGLLGIWANKGAIVMNFNIGGDDMCDFPGLDLQIFNCHLVSGHGREMLDHRRKELYDIQRKFEIVGNGKLINEDWVSNNEYEKYLYYDELNEMTNDMQINDDDKDDEYVDDFEEEEEEYDEESIDEDDHGKGITFFCGDLNYRIFMERTHIQQCLESEDYETMIELDGLTQERKANKVLINFKEGDLKFKPTYKFLHNSDDYDFNRIPSYCDRILYTPHHSLKQVSYAPNYDLKASDHKPIVSDFKLNTNLINISQKSDIISKHLKEQDKLENESRPVVEISRQDLPQCENHYLIPNTISTVLKNNGATNLSWEILLLENNDNITGIINIDPMSGELEPNKEQEIKITGILPIGVSEYNNTSILRVHNAQDFFISYSFKSCKSIFGLDLLELNNGTSGIPKPIYQLVNFLSEHNYQGMFELDLQKMTKIDCKLIRDLDEEKNLDLQYLDNQLMIENIKSVSKMLLLILKNLPNGIVPCEFSIKLINHFYKDKELIKSNNEEIVLYLLETLPSLQANILVFFINFFKILIKDYKFEKSKICQIFQNILFQIPVKLSKRKMVTDSNIRNLKKRRNDLLMKLLSD